MKVVNTFCLLASRDSSATKHVIWSWKSKRTAMAAYNENTFTAGMVVKAPEIYQCYIDISSRESKKTAKVYFWSWCRLTDFCPVHYRLLKLFWVKFHNSSQNFSKWFENELLATILTLSPTAPWIKGSSDPWLPEIISIQVS